MAIRVVLASPTYGPVNPEVHSNQLRAVMHAARCGVTWMGTGSADRVGWEAARNQPVTEILASGDVDGVIWADSDMMVPSEAYARLVSYGYDFVSGLYFQRMAPFWPNVFVYNDKIKAFDRVHDYTPNTVFPVGGFGFGLCYTSAKLLRALPKNPFKFGEFSEDLTFCKRASDAGFQPYVDTGILCEHDAGTRWVGEKQFKRWRSIMVTESKTVKLKEDSDARVRVPAVG